jgi:SAM-dependent methyltransferase
MLTVTTTDVPPWERFHQRWRKLEPPLRPDRDVCAAFEQLLADRDARALLLGVTPELTSIAADIVAVDRSESALSRIWPGDGPSRRALNGNWLNLPCASQSFSAAAGDGSLNCLDYPLGYRRLFDELVRVLQPGGRVVIRVYLTPDRCESLAVTRFRTMEGAVSNIHALKWRVANAVCAERGVPNIAVTTILQAFNRTFPDRPALRRATGWTDDDIAQVDAYERMPDVFSFPTMSQLLAVVPDAFVQRRSVAVGNYELAERCPLLVLEVKA